MVDLIALRSAEPTDVNFIFATALRNAWYSKELQTTLSKDKYMKLKHFEVEKMLDLYPTVVCCLHDEPDVILGYAINSPTPFIYIKKAWRDESIGVAKLLYTAINEYNRKESLQ